jgi:hypothetical protein
MSAICAFRVNARYTDHQKRLARIETPMQADHSVALDHRSDSFGLGTMV